MSNCQGMLVRRSSLVGASLNDAKKPSFFASSFVARGEGLSTLFVRRPRPAAPAVHLLLPRRELGAAEHAQNAGDEHEQDAAGDAQPEGDVLVVTHAVDVMM